ncbi:MAG TPA: precorrin-2 C(20)-methyltransferase [Clostridiales bacterium]|nr:precorrin-2 C(20)-methyltransferase [Clostridiales bacterium]
MSGILYGVGVGPGDPELMTVKAVRLLKEADVLFVPQSGKGEPLAYAIAKQAVPSIGEKPFHEVKMPMSRDAAILEKSHDAAATRVMELLEDGKTVAFLTLGDPSIYSTYSYVHKKVLRLGGRAEMIPGVPSFCAAAAALNASLAGGAELLHIIPASYEGADQGLSYPGTKVLMKTGKAFPEVKKALAERGLLQSARMVQRCGLPGQVIYDDVENAGDEAGYLSILVVQGDAQ